MNSVTISPMSRTARREGFVQWMSGSEYTHGITLMPNRPNISFDLLSEMFGWFCIEVDRYMLGIKHVNLRNSHDRLQMIAMPEKLGLNPHLHGVANFSQEFWGDRINMPWEWKLDQIWRQVTRGAGEIHIIANDHGLARYFTKEALHRDHEYLHSWDFHRHDRLGKRPSAISIQQGAPSRKAGSHK